MSSPGNHPSPAGRNGRGGPDHTGSAEGGRHDIGPTEGAFRDRSLWFVGIGGAGLSSYALLAHAWGAAVSGWDRRETPYLAGVREAGIAVTIRAAPPGPPPGSEVIVSTAFAGLVPGRTRADFLAELVELRPSVVVAGTHGKTTTAAMIAFCLDRLGHDPSFLIGGEVGQLGGNARAGTGWLVVEGDESDRTIASLRPELAVVTNVELDHHTSFASLTELEELFERWLAQVPRVVRGSELEPLDAALGVPGVHNRHNAACAVAALQLLGVERDEALTVLGDFRGVARRFEPRGEAGGALLFDDYAHHPTEVAAALAAAREVSAGRVLAVFQPHLYSRTRYLAHEFARALAEADAVAITEIYGAREEPVAGVSGKLVVDALADRRPGVPLGWTPSLEAAARFVARRIRPGDLVLTLGAGDVDRVAELVKEAVP